MKKPFTYVVAFTVSPLWTADGFTFTDERAHDMLWKTLGAATHAECAARVIHAPAATRIARCRGYTVKGAGKLIRAMVAESKDRGQLSGALESAIKLLDSVAYVTNPGDTVEPLRQLRALQDLIGEGLPLEDNTQAE